MQMTKTIDMRTLVEKGYDEGNYEMEYRSSEKLHSLEKKFLSRFCKSIHKNGGSCKGAILDLGSGTGIPYDKYLVKKGFSLTGIDISKKHITLAKKNVPEAKFIKGDFSKLKFKNESFDAIVSFYAIFHLPRSEHKTVLKKMHDLLVDDGIILITLGCKDIKISVDPFVGSKMAWSSYPAEKNKQLVERCGFNILLLGEEHHGREHHLWVLGQKRKSHH